ncbi:hypothetical protein NKR19_g7211 [Coniochaeta hoffmannii]|uniref:Uncharacterized protein n=1 Tax=Coniochaeta hoffmannii TaxID=91930 RepID=A0AA38RM82_9PEZI|nr:hypothetical protein NKR19_g7211 [Coniochaeta hoffmannii]
MPDDLVQVYEYHQYHPPGVQRVVASGSSAWIGEVDESTLLRNILTPGGDRTSFEREHRILDIVGPYPRIIGPRRLSLSLIPEYTRSAPPTEGCTIIWSNEQYHHHLLFDSGWRGAGKSPKRSRMATRNVISTATSNLSTSS